ncbi:MAG: ATP-binding cassette domain-containing protein [Bacteroidales bacterium]|nr:ATP-binding cassette domain-containing protein [Bacteroidales bacterium]
MIFTFKKLIPLPMTEIPVEGSAVWEADSFTFNQGKKYLVEAASGKGKTSLLSIMFGLRKDYKGKLFIDGTDARTLNSKDWSRFRKQRVSYIFQGLELFDDLSAMDNILLKNQITKFKTQQQIMDMAERLDMASFLHRKCRLLSFGQQQRIAIIRALCQPFEFLFADESFSHIDKNNSAIAMQLITEVCDQQGAGLILTSLGNNQHAFDEHITI